MLALLFVFSGELIFHNNWSIVTRMENLLIHEDKLLSECEPGDNLLPVIVNVFSLHDIGVVLETAHVNDTLKAIDQCSSPCDPIPAVETVANGTSAKPTEENFSGSRTSDKKFACTYCGRKFNHKYFLDTHIRTHTGKTILLSLL